MNSISRWCVPEVLYQAKGMVVGRHSSLWETNDVFPQSVSLTSICQQPQKASRVGNIVASPIESIHFSMRGNAYETFMVTAFSVSYSMQWKSDQFFFAAETIGAAISVWAGLTPFSASICLTFHFFNIPYVESRTVWRRMD